MDEEKEWWVCSICGPATHSRANWCDGGCGRDYQKMTKLVPETLLSTLREQIAREILSKCLENRHQGNDDGIGALTSDPSVIYYPETFRVCAKCEVAAAIARGEK